MNQGPRVDDRLDSLYDSLVDAGFHIVVDTSWKGSSLEEHYQVFGSDKMEIVFLFGVEAKISERVSMVDGNLVAYVVMFNIDIDSDIFSTMDDCDGVEYFTTDGKNRRERYLWIHENELLTMLLQLQDYLNKMKQRLVSSTIALMTGMYRSRACSRDMVRLIGQFYYGAMLRAARAELGGH